MSDPFARLIPEARAFLAELAENNTRVWFAAHKARYDSQLKAPAKLLMEQVAAGARRDHRLTLSRKLFRPQRDLRFPRDKTPYTTHLHMLWTVETPSGQQPGIFFGIAPGYATTGGGVMEFDKAVLADWRRALDGGFGADIQAALERAAQDGFHLGAPDLKRVPPPYAADHPRAGLMRRKGLTVRREMPAAEWDRPLEALTAAVRTLVPLFKAMRPVL